MPHFTRAIHLGLTVRDMYAKRRLVQQVLGFTLVKAFQLRARRTGISPPAPAPRAASSSSGSANDRTRSVDRVRSLPDGLGPSGA